MSCSGQGPFEACRFLFLIFVVLSLGGGGGGGGVLFQGDSSRFQPAHSVNCMLEGRWLSYFFFGTVPPSYPMFLPKRALP